MCYGHIVVPQQRNVPALEPRRRSLDLQASGNASQAASCIPYDKAQLVLLHCPLRQLVPAGSMEEEAEEGMCD